VADANIPVREPNVMIWNASLWAGWNPLMSATASVPPSLNVPPTPASGHAIGAAQGAIHQATSEANAFLRMAPGR
jgi:hypothetical protein